MLIKSINRCTVFALALLIFMFLSVKTSHAFSDPYLTWDENADADYYEVYIETPTEPLTLFYKAEGKTNTRVNLATTKFKDNFLQPGIQYTFYVKAFNECSNSSDLSDSVVYQVDVPVKVPNLMLTKSTLTWDSVADAIKYRITFNPITVSSTTNPFSVETSALSYDINTNNQLIINAPYYVTVAAVNDTGVWGAESNSVTYTRRLVRKCTNVKITKLPK